MEIRGLVLAGGLSSRMGEDKSALVFQGESLLARTFNALRSQLDDVYISQRAPYAASKMVSPNVNPEKILIDQITQIGPAAGLLEAYEHNSSCAWFVIACDFPFVEAAGIDELIQTYKKDPQKIAAYVNDEKFAEPLFAIWPPGALATLKENTMRKQTGPMQTLQQLGANFVSPSTNRWLFNANTKHDWQQVLNYNSSK